MPIVSMQPDRQLGGAIVGVRIGQGVGPFPESGLDEALGLAVGPGRIGPCPDMPEPERATGFGESLCAIAGAIVRHEAGDGDAEAGIVGQGCHKEGDCALFAFVGQDWLKAMREASSMATWANTPSRRRATFPAGDRR